MATILSWEPTLWKNHLYHHSPRFPPHASFPCIKIRKNVKNISSIKCFLTPANSKRNECLTSGREISKNGLGKIEIKQNPIEIVAKTIVNAIKTLQKSAAGAVLVGLLLMYNPYNNSALAASGGRMGGSSFSSGSSRSSSGGRTSRSFSSGSSSSSYSSPMSFRSSSVSDSVTNSKSNSVPSTFEICLLVIALAAMFGCLYLLYELSNVWVLKLQVGLVGSARPLQKDLNRIAETADTSTPKGLHYVLTETALALLRYPDYCIYADSYVDLKWSMEEGEEKFNKLSKKERRKFDELTLVNFNNFKRQSVKNRSAGGHTNGYIVVTILVASKGGLGLPKIRNSNDLKEALQKIASLPSTRTLAVEVLWTPQKEDDALSKQQLLQDYPSLRPL